MSEVILKVDVARNQEIVRTWRIVDTDNLGRDYPDEKFVAIGIRHQKTAEELAETINKKQGEHSPRYFIVVPHIEIVYKLQPGFEP